MNIFIRSHGRALEHRTFDMVRSIPGTTTTMIVDSVKERDSYLRLKPKLEGHIVAAGLPPSPQNHILVLNWILVNLAPRNEWSMYMDDNLRDWQMWDEGLDGMRHVTEIPGWPEYYAQKRLRVSMPAAKFVGEMIADLKIADAFGYKLYGTASSQSPFARARRYAFTGFVQCKCFAMKQEEGVLYDLGVHIREEYDMTALHHWMHGGVLINRWLYAHRCHFQKGGIGNRESRMPGYLHDSEYLRTKYPGFFTTNNKRTAAGEGAELRLVYDTPDQVDLWRRGYGPPAKAKSGTPFDPVTLLKHPRPGRCPA